MKGPLPTLLLLAALALAGCHEQAPEKPAEHPARGECAWGDPDSTYPVALYCRTFDGTQLFSKTLGPCGRAVLEFALELSSGNVTATVWGDGGLLAGKRLTGPGFTQPANLTDLPASSFYTLDVAAHDAVGLEWKVAVYCVPTDPAAP
ncbi:MAG: hypothetical protein QOD77_501 [Thermoplasmata archaeon]|jgi:hypothetical protein|nr:hypothetical protein [Thermoplasmata archaeon]